MPTPTLALSRAPLELEVSRSSRTSLLASVLGGVHMVALFLVLLAATPIAALRPLSGPGAVDAVRLAALAEPATPTPTASGPSSTAARPVSNLPTSPIAPKQPRDVSAPVTAPPEPADSHPAGVCVRSPAETPGADDVAQRPLRSPPRLRASAPSLSRFAPSGPRSSPFASSLARSAPLPLHLPTEAARDATSDAGDEQRGAPPRTQDA